jgi:hypothetical protein
LKRTSLAAFLAAPLAMIGAARADFISETPFLGVTHIHRTETVPRLLSLEVVLIDLTAPGIRFQATESNGPGLPGATNFETTREFVTRIDAQIGINANFFSTAFDPGSGAFGANLFSLSASNGEVVSPFVNTVPGVDIAADNTLTFFETTASVPASPYNAVSGNLPLIRGGVNVADPGATDLAPRSAIGRAGPSTLILLAVDGRNPGHSLGVTLFEAAQILLEYGTTDAFNLDGGGSTTLVFADPVSRLVNVPFGLGSPNTERPVGNNLAVFAQPVPEPGAGVLILLGASAIVAVRAYRRAA